MSNFIVPQSPAGAVPALYYISPNVLSLQQQHNMAANATAAAVYNSQQQQQLYVDYNSPNNCVLNGLTPQPNSASVGYPSTIHIEPKFYFHQYQNMIAATPQPPQQAANAMLPSAMPPQAQQFHAQYFSVTSSTSPIENPSSVLYNNPSSGFTLSSGNFNMEQRRFGTSNGKNSSSTAIHYDKTSGTYSTFLHPKFKTEICRKFDSSLGCPYGDKCQFRHPDDPIPMESSNRKNSNMIEGNDRRNFSNNNSSSNFYAVGDANSVKQRPPRLEYTNQNTKTSISGTYSPFLHPKFKTENCRKFASDVGCPYGENCQFRHPDDPLPIESSNRRNSNLTEGRRNFSNNNSSSNFYAVSDANNCKQRPPRLEYTNQNVQYKSFRAGRQLLKTKNHGNAGITINQEGCVIEGTTLGADSSNNNGKIARNSSKEEDKGENTSENFKFLNEKTLPKFVKFASKIPKNGMRRHNSQDTIGSVTLEKVTTFKQRLLASRPTINTANTLYPFSCAYEKK